MANNVVLDGEQANRERRADRVEEERQQEQSDRQMGLKNMFLEFQT